MQEMINKIVAEEKQARNRVDDAKHKARKMAEDAEDQAKQITKQVRKEGQQEAQQILVEAKLTAERQKEGILQQALAASTQLQQEKKNKEVQAVQAVWEAIVK